MSDEKIDESRFDEVFKGIEKNIADIKSTIEEDFIPNAEKKLKENILITVISSVATGFVLGLIFSLFGNSRGK